jgi:GntR family transcriptional regulator/MocR family aminotransferase
MAAGLHAILELSRGTERSTVQAADRHGLAVSGMAELRYEVADSGR